MRTKFRALTFAVALVALTPALTIAPAGAAAKPTVSITPSANPAPAPGNVGYLVSLTGVAGFTPAGSVIVSDGNGASCDINLSAGNGSCEINEARGTYHIVAEYLGSTQYKGASKAITERVQ